MKVYVPLVDVSAAKPTLLVPTNTSTVEAVSAVIVRVGVVSLVIVSAVEPVFSEKVVMVGFAIVESIVIALPTETLLMFPALSVALAVKV